MLELRRINRNIDRMIHEAIFRRILLGDYMPPAAMQARWYNNTMPPTIPVTVPVSPSTVAYDALPQFVIPRQICCGGEGKSQENEPLPPPSLKEQPRKRKYPSENDVEFCMMEKIWQH